MRRAIAETFHGSAVEFCFELFDALLRVPREVAPFGDVPADHAIGIFNAAFLPGVIRVAEIYGDTEPLGQFLVMREQEVVVGSHGAEFRKPLGNLCECLMHIRDGNRENRLDVCHARPSVAHREEDALPALPRDDEVSFGIPNPAPRIDILGSLVNEGAIRKMLRAGSSSAPTLPFPHAMALDGSPIRARDVTVYGILGE